LPRHSVILILFTFAAPRTFNAAYIISVILGVVVGEVAFGRLGRA
jgi:hypothetical protein